MKFSQKQSLTWTNWVHDVITEVNGKDTEAKTFRDSRSHKRGEMDRRPKDYGKVELAAGKAMSTLIKLPMLRTWPLKVEAIYAGAGADVRSKPLEIKCEPKDGNANLQVVLHTNRGSVEFRLFPEKALSTCLNFVRLIDSDYYNGLIFHRIIANFMIQGGCPNGNGRGGPGYAIRDEINDLKHHAGRLAMANSGANSAGSQFYVLVATPNYDVKKYTVFGEVTQGLEIVYLHSKVKTDKGDRPLETQRIRHMELRP